MSTTATAMTVKRTDLNPCTIKLEIVCAPEQVRSGFDKALKAFAKQVKVPGFRPGTAPKAMVEKMVPEADLVNAAAEEAIRSALRESFEQEKITPEDAPSVNITEFDRARSQLTFEVKVPLPAKVTLGEYKGLSAKRPRVDVSDEEVTRQIEELRGRNSKRQAVTGRGIHEGDVAVVNIRIEGAEGDGRNFMTMAGQTFAALDAAILGMENEEIKHARLDFPESFQEKDWAGKTHECTLTVRSVSSVSMPELDDEFAKSLNADNIGDLSIRVREGILRAKNQVALDIVNEQLLDQLLKASEVHVADTTWERVGGRRLDETQAELKQKGTNIEDHAKANGMTVEELVHAQMAEAKVHVERATLIREVFLREDMKISDEEANRVFFQIASENRVPQDDLGKFAKEHGPQLREEIVFRGMYSQVMKVLNDGASIIEVDPSELMGGGGEAPAKPAAKKKASKKDA